jgi:hypothetical protein
MGNVIAPVLAHEVGNLKTYLATAKLPSGANVTDLHGRVDVDPYLTPHSDIVGMMVLAHQTSVHNLITRAGYDARVAEREGDRNESRVRTVGEPLVRAMLFAEEFVARGPRDSKGRSLRDLDLERRLFKYPLSYLIYSESFDALPAPVKGYVFTRLRDVLTGADQTPEFSHLSAADRAAVLEILTETKPEFAAATSTR